MNDRGEERPLDLPKTKEEQLSWLQFYIFDGIPLEELVAALDQAYEDAIELRGRELDKHSRTLATVARRITWFLPCEEEED